MATAVATTATWGVPLCAWTPFRRPLTSPLWDIRNNTRAAAVTQARVHESIVIIAQMSMKGPSLATLATFASTLRGASLWSSVPAEAGKPRTSV